jgi:hypothetical protein
VELKPIWTLIGLPQLAWIATAGDLLNDIAAQGGDCSEVYHWYNGDWDGHSTGLPSPGFDLRNDEGYFVKCANALTYTPGAGASQAQAPRWPAPSESEVLEPVADPAISDLQVTNRRDVAFTVTWRTDGPSTGWVEYGETIDLGQTAHDDLSQGTVSQAHHVTLTGLTPETTYRFRLHSGETIDNNDGVLYQATTKVTQMPPMPYLAYGQVETADAQPAEGALLRVWLVDAENGTSEPLSTMVDGYGYWSMSLPVDECADLELKLQVIGRRGSEAELTQLACEVQPAAKLFLAKADIAPVYLPVLLQYSQ